MWNGAGLGRALFVLMLGALSAQGCGDDESDPNTSATGARPPTMGSGGSGRGGNAGGAGEAGAAGSGEGGAAGVPVQQPGGPRVRVLSPEAVERPADGGVLVDDEIDVICEVRKSNAPDAGDIEPSSVTVQLLDAEGELLDVVSAEQSASISDQFTARLIVAKVTENGRLSILCGASDRSVPVLTGADRIDTFIDHGPKITPLTPDPEDPLPIGAVQFRFQVEFDPVAPVDEQAAVDDVSLTVGGVAISDLEEDEEGEYVATVDFADRDLFPTAPMGAIPVTIRANNRREPEAVERLLSYPVVIDGEGPEIDIQSPRAEDVVGGHLVVVFTVSDELSEVDENSVVISLSGENFRYGKDGDWVRDGDEFTATLDASNAAEKSEIQISIQVTAADEAGNQSAEKVVVYLDTSPAIVELDPPNVRQTRENPLRCSQSFDPVGTWPPEDLDTVSPAVVFRALVWEMTNGIENQTALHYAATKPDSVELYIQWDADEPLVVDSNGDTFCDDLRSDYQTALPVLPLKPLPATGSAWFGPDDPDDPRTVQPPGDCPLLDETAPLTLCADHASDMRRIISHNSLSGSTRPSVIYAFGNLQPNSLTCTGIEVDLRTQTTETTDWDEGWLCVAAVSLDMAGNRGVSPPLRLCYDSPEIEGSPSCVTDKSNPPLCTDGCTLPQRFRDDVLLRP